MWCRITSRRSSENNIDPDLFPTSSLFLYHIDLYIHLITLYLYSTATGLVDTCDAYPDTCLTLETPSFQHSKCDNSARKSSHSAERSTSPDVPVAIPPSIAHRVTQSTMSNVKALEAGIAGEGELNSGPPTSIVPPLHGNSAEMAHTSSNPDDVTRVPSVTGSQTEKKGDAAEPAPTEDTGILTGLRLFLVFIGMLLVVFLFALDQSIVATAIPVIVSEFHSFTKVGWVITAYFVGKNWDDPGHQLTLPS